MRYVLWTIGGLLGFVLLLVILFFTIVTINVVRTISRYGDVAAMPLHGYALRTFYHLVEEYFQRKGKSASIRDGIATLSVEGESEPHQLGLQNLAQQCAQSEEKEWPDLIAKHFDALETSQADAKRLLENVEDYEKIKSLLAVRIMPRYDLPMDSLISRDDLEGTVTTLVFDLPTSLRAVQESEEKRWPIGLSQVWADALENTRRLSEPLECSDIDMDGTTFKAIASNGSYVTTHALLMHEHPDWLGPRGAIFAIPHRHALLVYPIRSIEVVTAVQKLIFVATGLEKEGPGSITANVYWYHDGKIMHLPYELNGKALNFHPPDEFVAMLNTLEAPAT